MTRRPPPPEALDGQLLAEAARLLLGPEFKRPLAKLLAPYHPNGPKDTLDVRAPFRWLAPPITDAGEINPGWRPVPKWVWPVLADMLHQRSLDLANESRAAVRLRGDIHHLVQKAEGQR